MLSESLVREAQALLHSGLSAREVGRKLGISHVTVGKIRRGEKLAEREHRNREKAEARRAQAKKLPKVVNPNSENHNVKYGQATVTWTRCPICGAKVQAKVECMACRQKRMELAQDWDCYFRELLAASGPHYPVPMSGEGVKVESREGGTGQSNGSKPS